MKSVQELFNDMFKEDLDELAGHALALSGQKYDYTDKQLGDALLIFMEVFMSKMYDTMKDVDSQEIKENLAEASGKELREFIRKYTGIDTHKLYE